MNVLLTCAGRRNYLVTYFKEALAGNGQVFATDASPDAPAMQEADRSFVVPKVDAPEYVECLLDICRTNEVGLLASVNDLELPVLASVRESFEAVGTRVVVSEMDVVNIAFDKWRTIEFLGKYGLTPPRTVLTLDDARNSIADGVMVLPLIVKPRWGTASIGIETVHDMKELELVFHLAHKRLKRTFLAGISATDEVHSVMIQECLEGDEYGLDVINDLDGVYVATLVKRKLAMRAGETDRALTVDDVQLQDVGCLIGQKLGHVGNLDCDVFLTPEGPRVLEMNPRFGGGYPFSHSAGANLPAALIAWAEEREPNPEWFQVEPNQCFLKCDCLVQRVLK